MSAKPLISFIVYSHDAEPANLRACLDSILQLSLADADREIIIVDNGETSAPLSMLLNNEYEITYIHLKRKGASAAYALALRLSTGRYVQLVGSTDRLLRAPYEHCLDLVRYHDPDVVLFDFTDKKECEHSDRVPSFLPKPQTGAEYMRQNNLKAPAWGYVFRKSVAATLTFRPGILHEDEEFTPQLILRCERVFDTHVKSYFYRKRSNSITHAADTANSQKRLNDKESIIDRLYALNKLPMEFAVEAQKLLSVSLEGTVG